MKVVVGPLAKSGLETRVGPNLPAAINAALVYYVGKLSSGRGPVEFPKFLAMQGDRGQGAASSGDGQVEPEARPEVEVDVDERIEAALFTDAERQGVSPTELAGHAVLVYLAELDLIGEPETLRAGRGRSFARPPRRANKAAS
jgi:hypothetical protein